MTCRASLSLKGKKEMKRKVLTCFLCLSMAVTSVPSLGLTVHAEEAAAENTMPEAAAPEAADPEAENPESGVVENGAESDPAPTVDGENAADSMAADGEATGESGDALSGAGATTENDVTADASAADRAALDEAGTDATAAASGNTSEKWYARVEAEDGTLKGKAQTEDPQNVPGNAVVVKNMDGGRKQASFSIQVEAPFDGEAKMKVSFRAFNPGRDLCYEITNVDGTKSTGEWTGLDSGAWTVLKESSEQTIQLQKGISTIEFFAKENQNAPDVDYIDFSWNGGTAEDMKPSLDNITVEFKAGDQVVKTLTPDQVADGVISAEELPTEEELLATGANAAAGEEKDFLGWYWGSGNKYEGAFPMKVQDAVDHDGISSKNKLVLNARYGKHVEGYPVEKVENEFGQRLIFEDNFTGDTLDTTKWVDKYLSSWSDTWQRTQSYEFHPEDTENNGSMSLVINGPDDENTTEPWCPEFDGNTVISGFTTGDRNALHNWNGGRNQVRNPHDTELTHINQYGYYEMRMKGQLGAARHSAWWLLGFEDVPEESAEVDIFEVQGRYNGKKNQVALHKWNDKDAFIENKGEGGYTTQNDLCNEWHVYGFNWVEGGGNASYPDRMDFYIDGQKYYSKNVNIDYPMIQLFSQYEKRNDAQAWTGAWNWQPYPNSMEIDYVRVYKDVPDEYKDVTNPEIKEVIVEDLRVDPKTNPASVELKTYPGQGGGENGGDYVEKNLPGTKSYVRVEWSDGVQTQEPVKWDPITAEDIEALKSGQTIEKQGTVTITSEPEKGAYEYPERVTMKIIPPAWDYTGITPNNDLGLLFDGKINEAGAASAEFGVNATDMQTGNVSITYNFQKEVLLSGIDLWTNYGNSQGIKAFEIAVWDAEKGDWTTLKDEKGQNRLFEPEWKTAEQDAEEYAVTFPEVSTDKVKIIVKDAGLEWGKVAMREIEFHTKDVVLERIEVTTQPAKTEYKEGEPLDTAGMVITGTFNNKKTVDIPLSDVEISGYDPATIGTQTVKVAYQGLEATFEVVVKKGISALNQAPVIHGAKDVTLTVGDAFDPKAGVTASDAEDDDLTEQIQITSNVDTAKAGKYEVMYTVTDSAGATATKTIVVTVKEKAGKPDDGNNNNNKPDNGGDQNNTDKPDNGNGNNGNDNNNNNGSQNGGNDNNSGQNNGNNNNGGQNNGNNNNGSQNNGNQNNNGQNNNQSDQGQDKVVKTGDTSHVGFWVLLVTASFAAVASVLFRRRSKR